MSSALRVDGDRLWSRLMAMAEVGATPAGGSNRQALSDGDSAGRELFVEWARRAGCSVETDAVGNLFSRRPGSNPEAPPIVLGSHLDTQPTGGRFDGVYGVLGALEVIETLNDAALRTIAPLEVAIWTNEEGSRFPMSMMGSAVWAGVLALGEARSLRDRSGVSVGEELDRLGWAGISEFRRRLGAYLELHIEQGPVLEESGSEIGVVTGVQGFRWYTVSLRGVPAHAGTTPMDRRRDPARALAAALDGLYESILAGNPAARVTPAQFRSEPVSPNTVPSEVTFSLDLRHPDAATLDEIESEARRIIGDSAARHGCESRIDLDNDSPPVTFDGRCVAAVEAAAAGCGYRSERIISGAGHDTCHVALRAPAAMIFVPCRDGLSHNEAESIEPSAAADGASVLLGAALELAGVDAET